MKFGHLELPAADSRKSLAFYRDVLGFKLVADQGPYVWIEKGGLEILLHPEQPRACPVYYTDELEAKVEELEQAGLAVERKGNCYHFRDPDGNEFQLVNPGDDHSGNA